MEHYRVTKTLRAIWFAVLLAPSYVFAAEDSLINVGKDDPMPDDLTAVSELVSRVTTIALGIAGAAAVAMIIWGGITLATSGGSEERTAKGKKTLTYAIGGLLLVMLSYFLVEVFVEILGGQAS